MLIIITYVNYAIGVGALLAVAEHFLMTRKAPKSPVADDMSHYAPITCADPSYVAEVR